VLPLGQNPFFSYRKNIFFLGTRIFSRSKKRILVERKKMRKEKTILLLYQENIFLASETISMEMKRKRQKIPLVGLTVKHSPHVRHHFENR